MQLPRMCVRRCTAVGYQETGKARSAPCMCKRTRAGSQGRGAKDAAVLRRGCVWATPHRAGSSAAAVLSATGR